MRKIFFLTFLVCMSIPTCAQESTTNKTDSIIATIPGLLDDISFRIRGLDRYKLYPTENIYTFLELDTSTGIIKQLQWSLDENKEFSVYINPLDLSLFNEACGTFELYPTKNMYQFLLLNKVTGNSWHVQWGMKDNQRWIKKIE